jgi:RNA exonuclease 4
MDCEMVGVGALGTKSALARVVLVNWHGNVLLDRIIRPEQTVTDYRTFVSGITEADLAHAGDLESCRQEVKNLLRDRVLVGHGLKNDLAALSLRHPWQQTRDTAKYEPFMKIRFEDGVLWPRKLKDLCADKLRKTIQEPGIPHSPYEDAMAALHLYKRVRDKWEKAMSYKIAKTSEILGTNFGAVASQ